MTVDGQNRCTYEYEAPPGAATPDGTVDVPQPEPQRCPHPTADANGERCLFHHLDSDYPADRVTEQFLDALADESRPPTFAGGQLSGLKLGGETLTTPSGAPIDLRGANIKGDLDLTDATVEVPLLLDGAAITGSFVATDAEFAAPVSLVDADVGRRTFLQRARVDGGIAGNGLSAGYLDARELTVEGPTVLTGASFIANVILARTAFDGVLDLGETSFDHRLDATGAEVRGPLVLSGVALEGDVDLVAGRIESDLIGTEMHVAGDADWRHTQIGGDLDLSGSQFESDAEFDDLSVAGANATFDGAQFDGETSFSTARLAGGETSFADAQFDGETWFTYATFVGDASFERAAFHGFAHLRDATFERDLSLREAQTTDQAYLHGSTVHGDFTAADAQFDHFQFSATIHGDASFEGARFDEMSVFARSTFGGAATFDRASFAGGPDFSDTRFTGPTSFAETEFLVEPSFDGTRFAVDPDLDAASYPTPASRDLDELRRNMVLARPETLQHTGFEIPTTALADDVVIPAKTSHLVEDDIGRTKAVTSALASLNHSEWHNLFDDGLRTARTAVAQLDPNDDAVIVFGVSVDADADGPEAFIQSASVAGVYARRDATVEFGHLDTVVGAFDYLIPVPAADDAFESGASVAILGELATATIRQQAFRTTILQRRGNGPNVNDALLPVLVAAAQAGDSTLQEDI